MSRQDQDNDLEQTKRLMGALGRMPPKHHSEMKLGKIARYKPKLDKGKIAKQRDRKKG